MQVPPRNFAHVDLECRIWDHVLERELIRKLFDQRIRQLGLESKELRPWLAVELAHGQLQLVGVALLQRLQALAQPFGKPPRCLPPLHEAMCETSVSFQQSGLLLVVAMGLPKTGVALATLEATRKPFKCVAAGLYHDTEF
eukprot:9495451-Pyramimonas_sp.AAC.2